VFGVYADFNGMFALLCLFCRNFAAEGVHPDEIAVAVGMQRVAEQRSNVANDAARQSALMYSSLDLGLQARKSTLQSRRASRANCIRLNNRWIRFVCLMYLVLVCSRGAAGEPLAPTFEVSGSGGDLHCC